MISLLCDELKSVKVNWTYIVLPQFVTCQGKVIVYEYGTVYVKLNQISIRYYGWD